MNPTHCPLCYSPLETREVAPCWICGHSPEELLHLKKGMHTYSELRVFGRLSAVLCDFCQVDFGSFDPGFFGLPRGSVIGFQKMVLVREVRDSAAGNDKYCPQCEHRLAFLEFVAKAREANRKTPAT